MEEKEYINADRPVYFSYARNSNRKPEWEHISDCMDTLLEKFNEKHIEYRLDKRDIGTGNKISAFENEIGWRSEVVVIVFSDKYFRSMHCMYEFAQIKLALEKYPEKRLMCIKSGNFNLADVNYIMDLEHYWGGLKQEYENIEYHRLRAHSETEKAAWENGFYMEDVRNLYSFFSSINYSTAETIDYDAFINDIIKYYKTTPKPELTPKPDSTPTPPVFKSKPEQKLISEPVKKVESKPQPAKPLQVVKQEQPQKAARQPKKLTKLHIGLIIAGLLLVGVICVKFACSDDYDTTLAKAAKFYDEENYSSDDYDTTLAKAYKFYDEGNYSEAVVYYEKIADKLSVLDQCRLGYCYYSLSNHAEAFKWFQKAATQGESQAQFWLGFMYEVGNGVPQNYETAAEWYRKSAEQGYRYAQFELGAKYEYGEGVPKNIKKAKEWYSKAAEQGDEDAKEALERLK